MFNHLKIHLNKICFSLLVLILLVANTVLAESVIVKIQDVSKDDIDYIYNNSYDVAAHHPDGSIDIAVEESELDEIKKLGYDYRIITTESKMRANLKSKTKDLTGYRSYDEMLTELQNLETDHPDIISLTDIGDSRGKVYLENGNNNYAGYDNDIWCVKLSDNVNTNEDEPNIIFDGEHHAREPISLEQVMLILNHLVDNYGDDPLVTNWVDNLQIWFIPLVNPDGHKIVWDGTDTNWRKNIRDNDGNDQISWGGGWSYPDGVDPNRNYGPEQWFGGAGTGPPSDQTYNGPYPFSEPGPAALRDLLQEHKFALGMSYHSYSELIMWPLGFSASCVAPDDAALAEFGQTMAATGPALYGGNYNPQQTNDLYPCSGTTTDFGYGVERVFYYITELATEFIPPAATMQTIINDNLSAALLMLDRVFTETITGVVTDTNTGDPVVANVFIPAIDDYGTEIEPVRSGDDYGRYYRMLQEGTYDMEFSAFGYQPTTVNDVEVTDDEQTIVNVELEPASTVDVDILVENDNGNPISGAAIKILDTPLDTAITFLDGYATIEDVPYGDYEASVTASGYGSFVYIMEVSEFNHSFNFVLVEPFFIDSFEDGIANWITSDDWDVTDAFSYEGDYSLTDSPGGNYGNNENSTVFFGSGVDLTDAISAHVEYQTRYDIESGYDYAYFQVSADSSNWTTLATYSGTQTSWTDESFDLSNYLGGDVFFRFKLESDTYVTEDGIYIDCFAIYKYDDVQSIDDPHVHNSISLSQNYPNPFHNSTSIKYHVPKNFQSSLPEIEIFNIKGQLVNKIELDSKAEEITWNGKDFSHNRVSSGVYFYKISGQKDSQLNKMILLK